jgi:hypothetical protein
VLTSSIPKKKEKMSLKERGAEYMEWTEKEQAAINDHSQFQDADEKATRTQMDRFFTMEKKLHNKKRKKKKKKILSLFCFSLSDENDRRKGALLKEIGSWDAEKNGRCPIRETSVDLWHSNVTDALQRRKRALERRLRRFESEAKEAEESQKKNEEKTKLREALLSAEQFVSGEIMMRESLDLLISILICLLF